MYIHRYYTHKLTPEKLENTRIGRQKLKGCMEEIGRFFSRFLGPMNIDQ